jgi:hypothetical protein
MSELKVNKISATDGISAIEIPGKVGIGTSSPEGLLSINGATTTGFPGIHLSGFSATELDIAVETGESLQIGEWDSSTDTATLNMIIDSTGQVGIGVDAPTAPIHISRDHNSAAIVIQDNHSSTGGPDLRFWKTRSGAATLANDYIGSILYYDDLGATNVAAISVQTGPSGAGSSMIKLRTKKDTGSIATRLTVTQSGNIGIGTETPYALLSIKAPDTATDKYDGIHFQTTSGTDENDWYIYPKYGSAGGTSNVNLQFNHDNADAGYLDDNSTQSKLNFTGQHRCIPSDLTFFNQLSEKTGLIVVSSGNYNNPETDELVTINDSIPTVSLSVSRNQKTAFGVISSEEDKDEDRVYSHGIFHTISQRKNEDDVRMFINSLGEGAIWVTSINGVLENGDYITTCEIPGYGMKQDDDILHNYTVAKITQDCTFDLEAENYTCEEIEHDGQTYKRAFVGCTYHCG